MRADNMLTDPIHRASFAFRECSNMPIFEWVEDRAHLPGRNPGSR